MSIFKVIRKDNDKVETLPERLNYITRASAAKAEYTCGINVSEWQGYRQMMLVKMQYGEDDGKAYYHYVLNPAESDYEGLSDQKLFDVGTRIANLISNFYGHYQVVMSIHFDTDLHIHFIANNIDFVTGNRLNLSPVRLRELKVEVNRILDEAGISPVPVFSTENDGQ